jgi:hypothetical protein
MGELRLPAAGIPRSWRLGARRGRGAGARTGGIELELRVFELYQVRGGKIVAHVSSFSEREALEAVGLGE